MLENESNVKILIPRSRGQYSLSETDHPLICVTIDFPIFGHFPKKYIRNGFLLEKKNFFLGGEAKDDRLLFLSLSFLLFFNI